MTTYETAQDAYLSISSIRFAYRLFGNPSTTTVPIVFNMHFRGTMDYWDPLLLNPIAARRRVLLIDNVGVGASSGTIPDSFSVWAEYMVQIIQALGFASVDVFGFSMGGYIAQLIALQAPPGLVRKLVIAGSGPSAGPGVEKGNAAYFQQLALASEEGDVKAAFLHTFFSSKEGKQKAGEMWWKRMVAARKSKSRYLTGDDVDLQLSAILKWYDSEYREEGSYGRLGEISCPVLVAGARNDMLVHVENSYTLWYMLVNSDAHLHLYPDSGHGFLNEYHGHFSELVNNFLDEPERENEEWF